jgi:hypothetical protein
MKDKSFKKLSESIWGAMGMLGAASQNLRSRDNLELVKECPSLKTIALGIPSGVTKLLYSMDIDFLEELMRDGIPDEEWEGSRFQKRIKAYREIKSLIEELNFHTELFPADEFPVMDFLER